MRWATPLCLLLLFAETVPLWTGAAEPAKPAAARGPLPPEQARKEFRLAPGLRIELVASDPQIESPVAMAFDPDGKLWVVEMRDYPNGPAKGQPAEGRIKVLEDRDGDGRYETARVFADQLLFANGLLLWKDGVIVTAAPHIIFLRDTDGDGKCDKREVLFEGFAAQNPQLRVSHPILGIDNWVYVVNGLRGGMVKRAGDPDAKPINLSGMDFRFDPVRNRYEAISGMGQYGNTFDDWGNRFVCDNNHHLRHVVLEDRYIKRNPYLAVPAVVEDISELEAGPLSSGGKIYPLSKNWTTSSLHAGRFTAACGVFIYRGSLLPEEFRGSAFTCDPTGNLVHQEVVKPHGATFRSKPPRPGVEFLATPDEWFRPVFLTHGPDDAMYVVDMCRAVIEHPEFMPPELKNRPDLTLGKDKGRIWRIVPEKHAGKPTRQKLTTASSEKLIGILESPKVWDRTTAQRLLLERQDVRSMSMLDKAFRDSKNPQGRIQAACLVEAIERNVVTFGQGDASYYGDMLSDPHPRVREQGLLLLDPPEFARDKEKIIELADDPDPRVRFQVALTLGNINDAKTLRALAKIAIQDAADRWTRLAVASSVPRQAGELIRLIITNPDISKQATSPRLALLQELAALVGTRQDPTEVGKLIEDLQKLSGPAAVNYQMAGLIGLTEGMGRRGTQLTAFLKSLPDKAPEFVEHTGKLLGQSAAVALESKREVADRLAAVRLLAHASWPVAEKPLTHLLADEQPQEIRLAAVRSLAAHPRPEVGQFLMAGWKGYTPVVRREVTEAMLRQPDRIRLYLQEVEAGHVRAADIDVPRTQQLINHGQADIRDKARKLLQANLPADRKQVLQRYRPALTMKANAQRGKAVFQKNCATCHRVGGVGVDVGADIADHQRTKTAEQLLTDILNPNLAIDSNYINYVVTTKAGKVLTGVIAAETASSITLKRAENQADVVLRQDIDEVQSTGVSLMPDGLEKTVTVQEMADLLAFLKNWRYLDGAVPVGTDAPRR